MGLLYTPIRRLEGITCWVCEDPEGIYDFINREIRREWEEDARFERRDPAQDEWLTTLTKRKWRLETLDLAQINLNPDITNYVDTKRRYNFSESLAKRRKELQESIKMYAAVIWPLVIRREDMQLVDGYCRYDTLRAMKVSKTYAYVGSL
jgi:disulfide oxidoreductase YuzD